jgi:hypothetical protein
MTRRRVRAASDETVDELIGELAREHALALGLAARVDDGPCGDRCGRSWRPSSSMKRCSPRSCSDTGQHADQAGRPRASARATRCRVAELLGARRTRSCVSGEVCTPRSA